jgi:hypothetical protein
MNYKNILSITLLIAVVGVFSLLQTRPWQVLGNVGPNEVLSGTTTPLVANRTSLCGTTAMTGTLGSVIVVGVGTGNMATSTIHLFDLPVGYGTSTIPLNREFKRGLIVEYGTGAASTTITYRCGS